MSTKDIDLKGILHHIYHMKVKNFMNDSLFDIPILE